MGTRLRLALVVAEYTVLFAGPPAEAQGEARGRPGAEDRFFPAFDDPEARDVARYGLIAPIAPWPDLLPAEPESGRTLGPGEANGHAPIPPSAVPPPAGPSALESWAPWGGGAAGLAFLAAAALLQRRRRRKARAA